MALFQNTILIAAVLALFIAQLAKGFIALVPRAPL